MVLTERYRLRNIESDIEIPAMPWTKQFDPKVALRRAMHVFWAQGYEGTSLSELLQAMGIQKGSFYDTYGSKHEVYLEAMDLYLDERFSTFHKIIDGREPKDALLALMEAIKKESVGSDRQKSCLALNCVLERAQSDPAALERVQAGFKYHEKLFATLIRKAQAEGSICPSVDANETSKVLLGLTMAMRVYGKAQAPASTLQALMKQVRSVLSVAAV